MELRFAQCAVGLPVHLRGLARVLKYMPAYINRPAMDPDTHVWRYMSLPGLIATARTKQLRFTRVDTFQDPFEGSVPQNQIDGQGVIFGGANFFRQMMIQVAHHYPEMEIPPPDDEEPWSKMTRLRRAKVRCVHASCWAAGDESEAMWRLYCTDDGPRGVGVALCTTLTNLELSLAPHDLCVSPVIYRHYHEGDGFTDDMDAFMHKRKGFQAEKEVRLLKYDPAQYSKLIRRPPAGAELDVH